MVRNVEKAVRLGSMDNNLWGKATWRELAELGLTGEDRPGPDAPNDATGSPRSLVALLPVGAVEAHGPHLPLITDVTIASSAAEAAVPGLRGLGHEALVLPPLHYTAAPFATGFPGTISVQPATVTALILDIAAALSAQGVWALVLVNAHLDPAHLTALANAVAEHPGPMPIVFPDITRKPWAFRMTDEFKSGASHAGQYETSVVMAATPAEVREDVRRGLPDNPASLSVAIRRGDSSFEAAGLAAAYCGSPAAATADEGRQTIGTLGQILVDAVREASL
ncbi:MAG: creatininase family protein [Longimicrobiales bacterium]